MVTYEDRLNRDVRWAFQEGSMHFEKESSVHKTLEKITRRLQELGIPYAVVGGMAMFFHGYRRFTDDVDILVTAGRTPGNTSSARRTRLLAAVCRKQAFAGYGIRRKDRVSGGWPIPRRWQAQTRSFSRAEESSVDIGGIHFLQLPKIIELKLASGMTNPGRLHDLGDVQKMIRVLHLPEELADQLNPFVQAKYRDLWNAVRNNPP